MATFSERIKELRNEQHLTQNQLADICGVKYRTYQDYEYGKCHPTALGLVFLADYFNVSLDYLMGRSGGRSTNRGRPRFLPTRTEVLHGTQYCLKADV